MTLPLTRPTEYAATSKAFQKAYHSTLLLGHALDRVLLAKYDGVCGLAVFETGRTPRMLSRTGEDYSASCQAILGALERALQYAGWNGAALMVAGEVWRKDCPQPKISGDFRQQHSVIRDFQFRVFDAVYLHAPPESQPYHVRMDRYRAFTRHRPSPTLQDQTFITYAQTVRPSPGQTPEQLAREMGPGYDGVVLWDLNGLPLWDEKAKQGQAIKFKPNITVDVRCTGGIQGEGKHYGRLGALTYVTADGKVGSVGTGFSDAYRERIWAALMRRDGASSCVGDIFEVEAMGYTPDGNLREPRFKGFRFDKKESD